MKHIGKITFGLILTTCFLFLVLSLCSPSSFTIPDRLHLDTEGLQSNYCGRLGLNISYALLNLFGTGTFFILLPAGIWLILYWFGKKKPAEILSTLGTFLLLSGICGFSAFLFPNTSFGSVLPGSGGLYGEMAIYLLKTNFTSLGSAIFLGSCILAGFVLCFPVRPLYLLLSVTGIISLAELIIPYLKIFTRFNYKPTDLDLKTISLIKDNRDNPIAPLDDDQKNETYRNESIYSILPNTEKTVDSTDTKGEIAPSTAPISEKTAPKVDFEDENIENENTAEESSDTADSENKEMSNTYPNVQAEYLQTQKDLTSSYQYPKIDLLVEGTPYNYEQIESSVEKFGFHLEKSFADFGLEVHVVDKHIGPVITMYEIALARGTRVSKIRALANDLEIALGSPSVRIVAPLLGKNTVGVEIPNENRQLVRLRDIMEAGKDQSVKMALPIFLGKNVSGAPMVVDLAKLPHLLIAGRTGTGKSVCLNTIIMSFLMTRSPFEVKMILIDPKMVELSLYRSVPHLMHPVVTDMKRAEAILAWAVQKMEDRYAILARSGVRNLEEYNRLGLERLRQRIRPQSDEEWIAIPKSMPYMVIVADEMADLVMTAGKEVEQHIIRLAQKSRAVGIHLVLATQKPTVDVITGLIKSNLPARIAFGVASRTDSQVVLDCKGAEQLLGNGDMLFLLPGTSHVVRGQGTFVSESEINDVTASISGEQHFEVDIPNEEESDNSIDLLGKERDSLYEKIIEYLFANGGGSVSSIQRNFRIGYPRAGRIFDCLERDGLISKANPMNKQEARKMLMTYDEWKQREEETKNQQLTEDKKLADTQHYPIQPPKLYETSLTTEKIETTANEIEEKQPFYEPGKDIDPLRKSSSNFRDATLAKLPLSAEQIKTVFPASTAEDQSSENEQITRTHLSSFTEQTPKAEQTSASLISSTATGLSSEIDQLKDSSFANNRISGPLPLPVPPKNEDESKPIDQTNVSVEENQIPDFNNLKIEKIDNIYKSKENNEKNKDDKNKTYRETTETDESNINFNKEEDEDKIDPIEEKKIDRTNQSYEKRNSEEFENNEFEDDELEDDEFEDDEFEDDEFEDDEFEDDEFEDDKFEDDEDENDEFKEDTIEHENKQSTESSNVPWTDDQWNEYLKRGEDEN